jgi:hypothetical protein
VSFPAAREALPGDIQRRLGGNSHNPASFVSVSGQNKKVQRTN